ncbi:undecaprenyldiphospho-muramoylpentapeptide beta-N-acetylglucosaminyltransferase [Isobaculum melis]|uniref:UDP-N-acetylglucosamine--N-acetylmuramyl-(pentapeptide) pyrophosphoryl-undecaprenol N-acetylglucosamine transferase n=1 Tax=Isobaculum melis TaxID=142588 RepID=A0A1H9T6M2_9LACT|nr:undecaprenyldiphospho-muramoylpentapeptide beta-N-acetylglucosaminyltransferase [Isobaculum melis]SER92900.1 UDP-N-acetylglucosamine-N-acetylmuramylpentapeptide N-acetylglucosamine transferase [Isobaculum melis]
MKIIVSGGGTGGHIYPALALIRKMKELDSELEVLYIGTEKGLERKIVEKEGLPFKAIEISGFKRSLSLENFKTIYRFLKSVSDSKKIVKEFKPDVVIGTGGYVCGPIVYAAAKLGVPTLIHEQNSVAGVANKFLAHYVDKIAICFEEAANDFPENKVVLTGNPRGEEVIGLSKSKILESYGLVANQPTLLIFGGSRGALKLNRSFIEAYPEFAKRAYQVLVVTGEVHYEQVKNDIEALHIQAPNLSIQPFVYNMPEIYANVDVVLGRSGATTIAEITALGIPSILVPSPYVTNDHQTKNARSLIQHGAALALTEDELSGETLIKVVDELMLNPNKRNEMAQQAEKLGMPDAATRLAKMIQEMKK